MLCDLLQKPEEQLLSLYAKKSGQYRELDYFILRMIKINATSPTSPYRNRYRSLPTDGNVDYQRLDLEDEVVDEDAEDRIDTILSQTRQVRQVLDELEKSDMVIGGYARRIFEHKFLHHESFSDWEGGGSEKKIYEIYNSVLSYVKLKIEGKQVSLFSSYNLEEEKQMEVKEINIDRVIALYLEISNKEECDVIANKEFLPNTAQSLIFLVCKEMKIDIKDISEYFGRSESVVSASAEAMRAHLLDGGAEIDVYEELYDRISECETLF